MCQTWSWASIEQTSKNFFGGNNRNRKETTLSKKGYYSSHIRLQQRNDAVWQDDVLVIDSHVRKSIRRFIAIPSVLHKASHGSHESFAFFDQDYAWCVWELHFFSDLKTMASYEFSCSKKS